MLGAAAATVAAAGVAVAAVAGGSAPAGNTGNPAAINRAGTAGAAVHSSRDSDTSSGQAPRQGAREPAAPARHPAAPARHPAAPVKPARPYLIYDSVMPSAIPAHHM